MAGRKYKKRDKKAEAAARPRKPSQDWEARKTRIRQAYGVKLPERTVIYCDDAILSKVDKTTFKASGVTPAPNAYSEPDTEPIQYE